MIHATRTYRVSSVADVPTLAYNLTQRSWTLCTAFAIGPLVFANDAFSEDGAQEFAVIRNGRQVESLTASWMTQERMAELVTTLLAGNGGVDMGPATVRANHPVGPCRLCA